MAHDVLKASATCNAARLYFERRGSGPAVLLIAGSTGDAGNFARTADLLVDKT